MTAPLPRAGFEVFNPAERDRDKGFDSTGMDGTEEEGRVMPPALTRPIVSFDVLGVPAPQGSKKHVGNGVMVEQSKALGPWRDAVAWAARDAAQTRGITTPLDGPLALDVVFRFPMPKSRPKTTRDAGIAPKTTAPDLDKLVRAVGDALTAGGLIVDDARICEVTARKVEVVGWTGAVITLSRCEEMTSDRRRPADHRLPDPNAPSVSAAGTSSSPPARRSHPTPSHDGTNREKAHA